MFCSNNDLVYENTNISSMESPSLHIKDVNTNLELMECSEGKNGKSASSNNTQRIGIPDENGIGIGIGIGKACDPWFSLGNEGKEFERGYTQHIKIPSSMSRNQETEYKKSPCGYKSIMGNQQFESGSSSLMMPLSMMTPQEKIEKLRRRQQMRALFAICKQQQEFRQNSSFTSCSNESQIDESLNTLVMNTNSLEDAILHQLQNVVSTLGIQIRICIRDSLFRLAQNALERKYAISSNEQVPNVVTQERLGETKSSSRKPEGETKTNPIDRIVAHLLFHRPPKLSGEHLQSQG